MAEEITRIRKGNDITMKVRLFDNGEAVLWDSASSITARLRSVGQDTFTQPLDTEVDGSDAGLLIVRWPASRQCYTGLYDLVVGMERNGSAYTTDAHAFALVATSAEAGWTAPASSDGLNVDTEYISLSLAVSSGAGTGGDPVPGGDYLTKTEAAETYQTINDETLQTEDKTVVGAINEVKGIAEQGGGSGIPDAVLYTPQELTDEQKQQARANIAAAPNYYDKNGFVISPLGMSAHNLRYIGFKETDGSTICYLLTKSRCLKMDFSTYEVFWDVEIEGSNDIWQYSCISLRVIDDVVYVIRAHYTTQSIVLVQLNDTDGSTIQSAEVPIKTYYSYYNFKNHGSPLVTAEKIYTVDNVDKKIMSFDLSTLQTEVLKDNLSLTSSKSQLLWMTNESKEYELVLCVFCENIIHVIREDGSIIDINIEQGYSKGDWEIYKLDLSTKGIAYLLTYKIFIGTMTDNGDGTYSANFSARKSNLTIRWVEQYSNSPKRISPIQSLSIIDPYNSIIENIITPTYKGAIFVSFAGESLISNYITESESSTCTITKLYV